MTDDFEGEWEDLTEKEILIGVLTELQQIRLLLQGQNGSQTDTEPVYECVKCGAEVPKQDREQHARGQHKAPGSMALELFEKVD